MKIKISIVIPAYNESETIEEMVKRLFGVMEDYCQENETYSVIFIDDGSKDNTVELLEKLSQQYNFINYLSLSRNFGHQHALKAGIDFADGDCVISMDCDLQHPPEMLPELIDIWKTGVDIVYTQRLENPNDNKISFFKRITSSYFYKILNYLSSISLEEGTADFRLLDKKVTELIRQNTEYYFFLRGYISWLGFKQQKVTYQAAPRFAGVSKYNFKKMFTLAIYGITSFSTKPLHFATLLGTSFSLVAFIYALYAIGMALFTDEAVSGWASVLVSVLFMGGIQLIILGIMGEYLGKLFMQAKNRPFYIINKNTIHKNESK